MRIHRIAVSAAVVALAAGTARADILYSPPLTIGPASVLGCFLTNVGRQSVTVNTVKVLRTTLIGSSVVRSTREAVDVSPGATLALRSHGADSTDIYYCKFNLRGSAASVRAVACALEPDGHCTAAVEAR
jgi:hypothetical protein